MQRRRGRLTEAAFMAVLVGAGSAACESGPVAGASARVGVDIARATALTGGSAARRARQREKAPARCPPEMARVGETCIDRWEAHLVSPEGGRELSPFARPDGEYAAASRPNRIPQGYISRTEAALACQRAGKRLCRASEWYSACSAAGERLFPYGDTARPGACNTEKAHLLSAVFGARTPLTFDAHYNSPRLNQVPGFLAKTGEYAGCATPEGICDLVGNLHEWVSDDVGPALRRQVPMEFGAHLMGARGNGAFMGGYFSSHQEHGRGCRYITTHHAPDYHDYSTGFRCCAEPR